MPKMVQVSVWSTTFFFAEITIIGTGILLFKASTGITEIFVRYNYIIDV